MWPKVAVGAVVLRGGEILLVRRRFKPSAGKWAIPGGHVEEGEELEKALVRELLEETDLRAVRWRPLSITEYIEYINNEEVRYHYVIIDFLVDVENGLPKPNEESYETRFFKLKNSLKLDLTISTRKLIQALLTNKPKPFNTYLITTKLRSKDFEKVAK